MPEQYVEDFAAAAEVAEARSRLYIQPTRPVQPGPWMWFQIDADENVIDWVINDGVLP